MRVIMRYDFPVGGEGSLMMRVGAKIIGLDGHVDGKPVLWVEEDPNDPVEQRFFHAVQPMWPVPQNHVAYVGRYTFNWITLHVYEIDG